MRMPHIMEDHPVIDTNQISAIRKHAPNFTQSLRKAGLDLDHIEPHALTWADLNRIERDARAAAKATIDRVADGTDERRAAEIEPLKGIDCRRPIGRPGLGRSPRSWARWG